MTFGLLGDHAEILSGFAFKSDAFNTDGNGTPLIRIRDVMPGRTSTFFDGELRLKFQVQNPAPSGHRMLRWTNDTSTSTARNVA